MNVSNSAFYEDLQASEFDLQPLGPNYCGPQVLVVRINYVCSCGGLFQPVLVVQSTQHGFATHSVAGRKPVSMLGVGR